MCDKGTPQGPQQSARIERAILGLMLDPDRQRPWSQDEIARAIGATEHVAGALARLHHGGLIHRWNDLITATRPAVRQHELTHAGHAGYQEERDERAVLELLLAGVDERPMCEADVCRGLDAHDRSRQIVVLDALDRLDGAGLLDRRGQGILVSATARSFAAAMSL